MISLSETPHLRTHSRDGSCSFDMLRDRERTISDFAEYSGENRMDHPTADHRFSLTKVQRKVNYELPRHSSEKALRELLSRADVNIGGNQPWDIRVHHEGFYDRVLSHGSLGL